jgi:hypothetical protein
MNKIKPKYISIYVWSTDKSGATVSSNAENTSFTSMNSTFTGQNPVGA